MSPESAAVIRKGGQEFRPGTAAWFREAKDTTSAHRIAAAGIIHTSAISLLGDELSDTVEKHLVRGGFLYKSATNTFTRPHANIVDSIATPIMRMAKYVGIGQEDPLFTAMVAQVYLIRASQTVQLLGSQEPVTRRSVDPETKQVIETTTDLREEARILAEKRRVGIEALRVFVESHFEEGGPRDVATYLGYAVELPPASTRQPIGQEIAKNGVASILPKLIARAQALGHIE